MIKTKYGLISIVLEGNKKKIDFSNSRFTDFFSIFQLLKDKEFLIQITT